MEASGVLTGKKGETVAHSETEIPCSARKSPVGAKIVGLGYYQDLALAEMNRNLMFHLLQDLKLKPETNDNQSQNEYFIIPCWIELSNEQNASFPHINKV